MYALACIRPLVYTRTFKRFSSIMRTMTLTSASPFIGLVHQLDGGANVFGGFCRHALGFGAFRERLSLYRISHHVQPPVALRQLLQGFAVGGVANQQPSSFTPANRSAMLVRPERKK